MLANNKFQRALKALLLIGLSLFLYSRIANGTLNYYIAQRFAGFTLLAIVGLVIIGVSYHAGERKQDDHDPVPDPEQAQDPNHAHGLGWGGVALVALPIVLGLAVPPRPLGAAALANREVNVTSTGSTMPAAIRAASQKSSLEKNILDWSQLFKSAPDAANKFAGEKAKVIGFVFRDERFSGDQFLATRFIVSCCVADSNVAGVVVRWDQSSQLQADQWVEVTGQFQPGTLGDQSAPVLVAQSVNKVDVPQQPYLYP